MNLGNLLNRIRLGRNLTLTTVARATGISKQALSDYEKGYYLPSTENLFKLLDFYGLNSLMTLLSNREILDITNFSATSKEKIQRIVESENLKNNYNELLKNSQKKSRNKTSE